MRRALTQAAWLGVTSGAAEVAVRVSSRQGLPPGQVGTWLLASIALATGFCLLVALAASRTARPERWVLGAWLGLTAAVHWRFAYVLNEFVRDPKVWLGVPIAFAVGFAPGWLLARPVPRGAWWAVPVLVAVGFTRAREPSGGAAGGPSVLVVSLDTTRADHVDGLPTFTRLAREGTRWTQAIAAAPITEPSHLAMLTGVAPFRSGVVSNGTDLGDQPALLSRVLSARGWATAAFVAGFPLHSKYGWGQGFQVYDDDFGALPGLEVLTLKKAWNQVAIKEHALRERSADRVLRRAVPWLEAHRDRPFFAFVHFYDPHGPYHSPRNGELGAVPREGEALPLPAYWPAADRTITSAEWLRQAYALEVETVDDAVGRLLAALGNRLDGTVVIVTADHGESLGEHAVWFDHGDDLYDPSLRVPLVVRYPPKVAAGVTRTCQVAGVDVAATVLDLLGVDDGLPRDGRSLAETTCGDRAVVSSTTAGRFVSRPPVDHALRAERRKLILPRERPVELYDLEADPGELRSLAPSAEAESRAAALRALLEQGAGTQAPSMDAETRAMLERLGYLDEN